MYDLNRHLKQSVLFAGLRIKSGSEFQAIGPATEKGLQTAPAADL